MVEMEKPQPLKSTLLSFSMWASRGHQLTRPSGTPGDWGSHNWALGTWERANPGRQPGVTRLTLWRPIPSSSAPCSSPNLPLGGVDELQAETAAICVPGAKMAT